MIGRWKRRARLEALTTLDADISHALRCASVLAADAAMLAGLMGDRYSLTVNATRLDLEAFHAAIKVLSKWPGSG